MPKINNIIYSKNSIQFRNDNIVHLINLNGKSLDKNSEILIKNKNIKPNLLFTENNIEIIDMDNKKLLMVYIVSRPAVPTSVIVSWRRASRERTRDGASMHNQSCIDSMTNEPARESPASILLSTARIEIHVKVHSRYFAFYRFLREELSFV